MLIVCLLHWAWTSSLDSSSDFEGFVLESSGGVEREVRESELFSCIGWPEQSLQSVWVTGVSRVSPCWPESRGRQRLVPLQARWPCTASWTLNVLFSESSQSDWPVPGGSCSCGRCPPYVALGWGLDVKMSSATTRQTSLFQIHGAFQILCLHCAKKKQNIPTLQTSKTEE